MNITFSPEDQSRNKASLASLDILNDLHDLLQDVPYEQFLDTLWNMKAGDDLDNRGKVFLGIVHHVLSTFHLINQFIFLFVMNHERAFFCENVIPAGRYKSTLGACELLAKFEGISTGSAGKAIQLCKTDEEKVITSQLGRPKKEFSRQEYNLVRKYIGERNAKGIPTYSKQLTDFLQKNGYSYSKRTVQSHLTK
ncbi:hypothetical protein BDA99DRAFT_555861 [Phascolomyces articulosus]|uniref:Uncharacterized protein n=1 Tax=Phascolomyces articulosus TaxID=60185 RepID=A0AAD5KJV9_9FUNG|nr:hypothetical protein BDA99DRAFT_555861 [Phascolomyces articulosus]